MKTRYFFYAALALVVMSCAKEVIPASVTDSGADVAYVQKTFTAGIDNATKTSMVNGCQIDWVKGDDVAVFDNVNNTRILYEADAAGATTTLSSATGVASTATEFYAMYPNRSQLSISGDVISDCYITPDQRPSRGKYYVSAHYMMSKADALDNFSFKSVNGFIKFTLAKELDKKVQTIYIFANNDEEITGLFTTKWNDGEPVVTVESGNSGNKTYVRAYNQSNNQYVPLSSGDYYLSILPTEFTEGFTVVLQMTDGTQLSKRTDKNIVVKSNQILPMKELAVEDYDASNINYYVLWNEGFSFELGGITVNKEKYATAALRSNAINWDVNASDGLTFLTSGIDKINIKNITATDRCVIGMDKNRRSKATLASHLNITSGGTNYLLANIDIQCGDNQLIRADGGTFGKIAVVNCGLLGMTNNPFNFDQSHKVDGETAYYPANISSFVVEDCDIIYKRNADCYLICKRKNTESTFGLLKLHNNVIHSDITMNDSYRHRIIYGEAITVGEFVMTNNTFVNLQFTGNFNFCYSMKGGRLEMSNNIFDVNLIGTAAVNMYGSPGGDNKPSTASFENNYYYLRKNAGNTTFNSRNFSNTNDVVLALSKSPLSLDWDPADGKFGAYTIVPAAGAAAPTGLVGAQRPDMDPVTAAVNSAAYGYETNDLGKL